MVRDIVVFMHITLCKVVLLASCDIRSEVFPFSIITISTSTNTPYSVLVLPDSMCDNRNPSIEERIGDALQSAIHSARRDRGRENAQKFSSGLRPIFNTSRFVNSSEYAFCGTEPRSLYCVRELRLSNDILEKHRRKFLENIGWLRAIQLRLRRW
ncbi:hypothetical protein I7I51_04055 [Histoplasma capsulatum]|uniref:Uncharacterized protein n=1 Tax=Ajellomyces capsulatus TaxID=5037 RepID=A0A8A1M5X2_AJECA|nr:hypothetical protein I7I51_04055 [Histoplasma capsulatum]